MNRLFRGAVTRCDIKWGAKAVPQIKQRENTCANTSGHYVGDSGLDSRPDTVDIVFLNEQTIAQMIIQGGPDSIRQVLIINNQINPTTHRKMGKYLLLPIDGSCHLSTTKGTFPFSRVLLD
jgi:hypothetical protein